jgi:anti-anti-sigma factor
MTGFSLDVRGPTADGITTVVPQGELDVATVGELESWLDDLRVRCAAVVVDLSQLEFIDSSGLRAIARARAKADHARTALRFVGPAPAVRRAFEIAGLDLQGGRAPDAKLDPEVGGVPDLRFAV